MTVQCGYCGFVYSLSRARDLVLIYERRQYFDHVASECPACRRTGRLYLRQEQTRKLIGDGFIQLLHTGWVPMVLQGYAQKQREMNSKRKIPITNGVKYELYPPGCQRTGRAHDLRYAASGQRRGDDVRRDLA